MEQAPQAGEAAGTEEDAMTTPQMQKLADALTTAERVLRYHNNTPEAEKCRDALVALRAAPEAADAAEPVAWHWQFDDGSWGNIEPPSAEDLKADPHRYRPLYAHPASAEIIEQMPSRDHAFLIDRLEKWQADPSNGLNENDRTRRLLKEAADAIRALLIVPDNQSPHHNVLGDPS